MFLSAFEQNTLKSRVIPVYSSCSQRNTIANEQHLAKLNGGLLRQIFNFNFNVGEILICISFWKKIMVFKAAVLSIDGGGIKGIVPAMILEEIEKRTGKRICQLFDLIAGTSTGGILALGLTKPNPDKNHPQFLAKDLVDLYVSQGAVIFQRREIKKLNPLQRTTIKTLLNLFSINTEPEDLFSSKYSINGKTEIINKLLGDVPIKSALAEVLITSYATNLRKPFFFTSHIAKGQKYRTKDNFCTVCEGYTMQDAAMATSAAPTYFKPYPLNTPHLSPGISILVDGGIFANNPTSIAIIEAIKSHKMRTDDNISLDEVLVVSLGTGSKAPKLDNNEDITNWGQIRWIEPLINMVFISQSKVVDYQMEQLLSISNQYYRLQPQYSNIRANDYSVKKNMLVYVNEDMDDVSRDNIDNLVLATQQFIRTEDYTLNSIAEQLLQLNDRKNS